MDRVDGRTLAPGEVQLFWLRPRPGACWADHPLLDDEDRRRLARTRNPQSLALRAAARVLLRLALSRIAPVAASDWRFAVEERGRPRIRLPEAHRGLSFGIAHTRGIAVCAVAGAGAVGVDVEAEDRALPALALARRFLSPAQAARLAELPSPARERSMLEAWLRGEAAVKAAGLGIAAGLSRFVADPLAFGPTGLRALRLPPGHRVAVALLGPDAPRLRLRSRGALDQAAEGAR